MSGPIVFFDASFSHQSTFAGEAPKKKGVGGRLKAAAERLRGRKAEGGEEAAEGAEKKARPARPHREKGHVKGDTKGKGKTTSAPRKAGGS